MMDALQKIMKNEHTLFAAIVLSSVIALVATANFSSFGRQLFHGEETDIAEEERVSEAPLLKIGYVGDWEYGYHASLKHKLTSRAPQELGKVVKYFNAVFKPDIVVGGGDYIESSAVKPERAKIQLKEINAVFEKVAAPRLYALGNHDMRSLSKSDVREILGIPENHAIYDVGDWRIVVVDMNYTKDDLDRGAEPYTIGHLSPSEKSWLEAALGTDRPVIVFGHHSPLIIPNGQGTGFIQNLDNPLELRSVLEKAGNVVAFVSGHNTMSYYEERNGIHYFIVDTLVRAEALGSFATIEARYAKDGRYAEIRFRQQGANKAHFVVDRTLGEQQERNLLPEMLSVPNIGEETGEEE